MTTPPTPFLNLSPSNPIEGLEAWCLLFMQARGFLCAGPREAEDVAAAFLREHDYAVAKNRDWLPARDYAARMGVSLATVVRRIKDPRCPEVGCEFVNNGSGRIRMISPNTIFDAFVKKQEPSQPLRAEIL